MKTLEQVKENIKLRLRDHSIELKATVEKAAKCIVYLMDHGCAIEQVTVRYDYAVIDIAEPSEWLKGSIHVRRVNGGYRELVMVTTVRGCQVQWLVHEPHPLLQREG